MRLAPLCLLPLVLAAADHPAVSLQAPQGEQAPDCVYDGAAPDWVDGGNLIALSGSGVVARAALSGREAWRVQERGGRSLRALGRSGHLLFLGRAAERAGSGWSFAGCTEVLVLDLARGAWLEPLVAAPPADQQVLAEAVLEAHGRRIIAWHRWAVGNDGWRQEELIVSALAAGNEAWVRKAAWTRRWPCQQPVPPPGAYQFGLPQPTAAGEDVVPLLSSGDALIVCPGPTSPIQAIAEADGTDRWTVERLWEFARDFIGPSVWCHEMRRFGRDAQLEAWRRAGTRTISITPEDKAAVEAQLPGVVAEWRKDFDAHHSAWLAGGPWLVPRPMEDGERPPAALLVAVAIAPQHRFARNLAEVRLYDLGEHGEPLALRELPRPPGAAQVAGAQLVFTGMPLGIGAVRSFPWSSQQVVMGGGPDCLLSLAWYSEAESSRQDAWLQAGWAPPPVLGAQVAVVPRDGGVILRRNDEELRVALDLLSMSSGEARHCSLRVHPAAGRLPQTNYRQFTRADGSLGTITLGPLGGNAPTAYRIVDDHLIVTLGETTQAVFTLKPW